MKREYAFAVCLCGLAAVALDGASLGTEVWAISKFNRTLNGSSCTGSRTLGLFNGQDVFDQNCFRDGKGPPYSVVAAGSNEQFQINTGFDIAVIAFCGVAIVFGLLVVFVAGYNVCSRPYETYAGPTGLLVYLCLGVVFTLVTVIMYIVFGFVEVPNSYTQGEYKSTGMTFGYSFYIFIASLAPFILGIVLLFLSGKDIKKNLKKAMPGAKKREKEQMEYHDNAIEF